MNATVHGLTGAVVYLYATRSNSSPSRAAAAAATSFLLHAPLDAVPHFEPASLGWNYIHDWRGFTFAAADNVLLLVLATVFLYLIPRLYTLGGIATMLAAWVPDVVQWAIYKGFLSGPLTQSITYYHDQLHFWRVYPMLNPLWMSLAASASSIAACIYLLLWEVAHAEHETALERRQTVTFATG